MAGCGIRPTRGNRRRVNPDSSGKKPPLSLRRGVDVGAIFQCPLFCNLSMSGSGPALRAVPSIAVGPSGGPLHAREKPRGGGGRSLPAFLSAVAAFKQAADVSDHVLRDHEEVTSRRRPHNAYPAPPDRRARRNAAHRLLAAGELGPSPCGTGFGMLLHRFEKADISGLRQHAKGRRLDTRPGPRSRTGIAPRAD